MMSNVKKKDVPLISISLVAPSGINKLILRLIC